MRPCHRTAVGLAALTLPLLVACAGCFPDSEHSGVNFYLNSTEDLRSIARVAMIELPPDGHYPDLAGDTTDALATAIISRRLFAVSVIRRTNPLYERIPSEANGDLTLAQIAQLRRDLGCDAILLGAVTAYQPYPHMRMALQLKLLDLRNGRLVWAVDQVWDTSERTMERRLRCFFREHMRDDYDPVGWRLALVSPRAFQRFVASETADTLLPTDADKAQESDDEEQRQGL